MVFSFLIGIAEKFFATELEKYLQSYHQTQLAKGIANAPVTNQEELAGIDKL